MKVSEDELQISCFEWIELMRPAHPILEWVIHVPNGGKRPRGAAGKLNSIGPERAAMIAVFLMEIAAHPEFMPADVDPTQAPLKAVLYDQLKRMLDHIDAYRPKLAEALRLAGDDLSSDFSAYYTNTQACAKRKQPNAAQTISTLKPYMAKSGKKKAKTTPPAKS